MKTSELTGAQLDWAVAVCKNLETHPPQKGMKIAVRNVEWEPWWVFTPSTNWAQGGPIIEQESMTVGKQVHRDEWSAESFYGEGISVAHIGFGPTPLIAAMRCYAISKLGAEIDIPEELV